MEETESTDRMEVAELENAAEDDALAVEKSGGSGSVFGDGSVRG